MTLRLGLFASHTGTNLQAILDACASGVIDALPAVVISNNSGSLAFERAKRADVPAVHLSSVTNPGDENLDAAIVETLKSFEVDLVVLCGYLKKVGPQTIAAFPNRIINIHPALLPQYGGQGMYGEKLYKTILSNQEKESGLSIHLVTEEYDQGPVVAEIRVPVLPDDDVASLELRVREPEHALYVDTLAKIANGEIKLG